MTLLSGLSADRVTAVACGEQELLQKGWEDITP